MSRISTAFRKHQESARTRRELRRALSAAGSDSVRTELVAMAARQGLPIR